MKIRILNDIDDFQELKSSWEILYNSCNRKTIFQSFEFNYYSWFFRIKEDKNTLALVLVYNADILTSLFPLYIDIKNRVRFINDNHVDSCDCLSISDFNLDQIFNRLKDQFTINSVNLKNLRKDANLFKFNSVLDFSRLMPSSSYSFLKLEKGIFPDNFSFYKSKQKTEFRRIKKIHDDKEHQIMSSRYAPFPFSKILSLKNKMISLGKRDNSFLPSLQLDLIKELYDREMIILSVVVSENTINALSFVMKDNNEYLIWIDLYDESRMINIFNYLSLISCISSSESILLNFGRGEYQYKLSNFLPNSEKLYALNIFYSRWQKIRYNIENNILCFLRTIYRRFIS